jgi:hypothetical protein
MEEMHCTSNLPPWRQLGGKKGNKQGQQNSSHSAMSKKKSGYSHENVSEVRTGSKKKYRDQKVLMKGPNHFKW